MIKRHLYAQIYAAFVLITVLSVGLAGAVASAFFDSQREGPPLRPIAELLAEHIDPADPAGSTAELGERLSVRLGLWSPGLEPLGGAGERLPPPRAEGPDVQWLPHQRGPAVAVKLADGRWIAAAYSGRWEHRHFVVGLVVLGLATSLLTWPLARRITRRLNGLRHTVDRWGQGELGARATVVGHDEVAALGVGFNQAADRVEALLGSQQRLLASASHELRSPLARLRMALALLDSGDESQRELHAQAIADIEELDALVGDLLLASRLQGQPTRVAAEAVDLGAIAREEAARTEATARGAASTQGDPRLLRRALRNLLENARKHGGGAAVEIEVGAEPPALPVAVVSGAMPVRASVWVVVRDRGPGVPEAERERIFEAFYRPAGHAEGRDGGVGLGLALVRDIAAHHGGTCFVRPREGGGSEFWFGVGAASA